MRKILPILVLLLAVCAGAQTKHKPIRVPLILLNPGAPVPHWGCPAGYTLRQHTWETLPTGEMRETWHTAMSDYTLVTESMRHFNACVDEAIPDYDPQLKKMGKQQ